VKNVLLVHFIQEMRNGHILAVTSPNEKTPIKLLVQMLHCFSDTVLPAGCVQRTCCLACTVALLA